MYFNHAFHKMFLGTGVTRNSGSASPTNPHSTGGFITTSGMPSSTLASIGKGYFGFFDPNTWKLINNADLSGNNCCPLVLASASLMSEDKIGPFAGGYKESNKSKLIKPTQIRRFYRVDHCEPQQNVISIGNTPYTDDEVVSLSINTAGSCLVDGTYTGLPLVGVAPTPGSGYGATATISVVGGEVVSVVIVDAGTGYVTADTLTIDPGYLIPYNPSCEGPQEQPEFTVTAGIGANCCKEFLCDETYYMRIDVKGSPALRFLNHNAYWNLDYYTDCCTGITPTPVDSTLVMIGWANEIVTKPTLQYFLYPIVYDELYASSGSPALHIWYPPNTTTDPEGNPVPQSQWWSNYISPGHTADKCAGIRLYGAYVDTVFNTCTFQPTDFFMKEPLKILASEVDWNGDPCVFSGLCVIEECPGLQGMGFGDSVLKDLIMAESYLQNFVATDLRIREITLGTDIVNSVSRTSFYTRYTIQHSVPRYNNPSGTYDNDQYALEVVTNNVNAAFETFMETWMGNCGECVTLEEFSCGTCEIVPVDPRS